MVVERGYIWACISSPPTAEHTLPEYSCEVQDSCTPSPTASALSGTSGRSMSYDNPSSPGNTASDSGSSISMPDLLSRDNLVPDVVDMRFSDDPSPPALTTLSPVVRLRAECYRAEQILTGAIEDSAEFEGTRSATHRPSL